MSEQTGRIAGGADVLVAHAYGNTIPAIQLAALDTARELYGPGAELRIEHTGEIFTSALGRGKFQADVTIRCLSFPGEDR